jgi:hypothetical protein
MYKLVAVLKTRKVIVFRVSLVKQTTYKLEVIPVSMVSKERLKEFQNKGQLFLKLVPANSEKKPGKVKKPNTAILRLLNKKQNS